MQLHQLELVLAIAETGSIRSAAVKLNRTQPTLTKALRQLEEELATTIFERSTRGMKVSKMGELVVKRARTIINETSRLRDEIDQELGNLTGRVGVCVSPFSAVSVLPHALVSFYKKWPDVEVQVSEEMYPIALNRLREGRVDMAIGPLQTGSHYSEFDIDPLFTTDLIAVVRQGSTYSQARSLQELSSAHWIVLTNKSYLEWFEANGLAPPKRVTWLRSLAAIAEIMKLSDYCCLYPRVLFNALPPGHGSVQLALREEPLKANVCLFTRSDSPLTPAANALARSVKARIKELS